MTPGYDANVTEHHGEFGSAIRLTIPATADAAETVCSWLITAPAYHPAWQQYVLIVVRLRDDVPGFPVPVRHYDGTTHEFLIVTLDPDHPVTAENIWRQPLRHLLPVNACVQFEATDAELEVLAWFGAWAVVTGRLNPETADAPTRIREQWKAALIKTLAHVRGEEHAS